jgi:hypothetical protein
VAVATTAAHAAAAAGAGVLHCPLPHLFYYFFGNIYVYIQYFNTKKPQVSYSMTGRDRYYLPQFQVWCGKIQPAVHS